MYYQKDIDTVMKECQTNENGLSFDEVKKRHEKYGMNELDEKKKDSPLVIFLKQFQDLLVIILIHK